MAMYTVRQLMNARSSAETFAVAPDDNAYRAVAMMAERNISAVLVLDDEAVVGIFTERDALRKLTLQDVSARQTLMRQVMSGQVVTVGPSTSLQTCMELMHEHHIRHLPIVEAGRLVGMVSMRDVVNAILSDQQTRIEYLETTISGQIMP